MPRSPFRCSLEQIIHPGRYLVKGVALCFYRSPGSAAERGSGSEKNDTTTLRNRAVHRGAMTLVAGGRATHNRYVVTPNYIRMTEPCQAFFVRAFLAGRYDVRPTSRAQRSPSTEPARWCPGGGPCHPRGPAPIGAGNRRKGSGYARRLRSRGRTCSRSG